VATFPFIRPDIPPAAEWVPLLDEAYRGGRFSNYGPISLRLERLLAGAWGGPDTVCIAASSGTAAIAAPLLAGGVTGRVILPAFTFVATLSAVRMAGAEPILVDVDPNDWRVAPHVLREALAATGARSAVMLAPFGMRSDFSAHAAIVAERGGLLVVDNAAGLGTPRTAIETAPHCSEACSLHATKPLAIGEGGVVFAHRSREDDLRRALNFGLRPGPVPDLRGHGASRTRRVGDRESKVEAKALKATEVEFMAHSRGSQVRDQAPHRGDVETTRNWMISQGLPIDRLHVAGVGLGAAVAAAWTAEDANWPSLASGPQGGQVRGLVMIAPLLAPAGCRCSNRWSRRR